MAIPHSLLATSRYIIPSTMLLFRRHTQSCPHRSKGRDWQRCICPIWMDGLKKDSIRYHYSLKTADWPAAVRKLLEIERGEATPLKPIADAVSAWKKALHVQESTMRNYQQAGNGLLSYAALVGIKFVDQVTVETIEKLRDWRKVDEDGEIRLQPISSNRELAVLRIFFGWCKERGWIMTNPAREVRMYRVKPANREPFTREEVATLLGPAT